MSYSINSLGFNVIWVNGMPRSGTSWLGQIFDSHPDVRFRLSPLFSYAFKNYVNEKSSRSDWLEFFEKVYHKEGDRFLEQSIRKETGEYPVFKEKRSQPSFLVIKDTRYHNLTTHILELLPEVKIVFLIRNPCAAIYSWLNAPREFPPTDDPLQYWRNGLNRKTGPEEFWGFDDWVKLAEMYTSLQKRYPNRIFLQRFEDLVRESMKETKVLFQFTGLGKVPNQVDEFLSKSHSVHSQNEYSVYKDREKVMQKWKMNLPGVIQKEIEEHLVGTKLAKYLSE